MDSLPQRSAACVTTGCPPIRRAAPPVALVIIVIAAYAILTALGVGQCEVLTGLGSATALGLRAASRLSATTATAAADV
jgi:hypothetical protein